MGTERERIRSDLGESVIAMVLLGRTGRTGAVKIKLFRRKGRDGKTLTRLPVKKVALID